MERKRTLLFTALLLLLCFSFALAEESPLPPEGYNRLTLYWQGDADLSSSDVWVWYPGKDGKGYLFEECDYGFRCVLTIPKEEKEVGFIVRLNCSEPGGSSWGTADKDFADDRFAQITSENTEVYLRTGDGRQYSSDDGGKTLSEIRVFKMAAMISETQVRYTIAPAMRIESLNQVHVKDASGREIPVEKINSLGNKVITGVITLSEKMDIRSGYTLEIEGYGEKPVIPTEIFDSKDFIENNTYSGDDLGAVITESGTCFKVWAPTASRVVLNLFEKGDGCEAYQSIDMEYTDHGVWFAKAPCGHGTYYTYSVTTSLGTQDAVDPYARSAGVNGSRGMVLDEALARPEGWEQDTWTSGIASYEDAVIWEAHTRDFSVALPSSRYPGKYLAFTETGLTNAAGIPVGLDHLKELGITHIHLQPIFDFSSVNEAQPDSGYNWGYDPQNYNVPEGSYSTDPYDGTVRVKELREAVMSLHQNGIGVIMDMVYNHTADANSNLNRIVPYYYYRYTATGDNSNGSGCGNETASERVMMRKYILDSVIGWSEYYHMDGFRFDLMALHDVETMSLIESTLHASDPDCILYGEGWTGGTSALKDTLQTTQKNISRIHASEGAAGGIAVFNDAIRDGLKGSVFTAKETGYVSGTATKGNAYKVIFGLTGGQKNSLVNWSANDRGVINYMGCHDNLALWDKLAISCPDASEEERVQMQKLGAAALFLSRGTPFMLAGEEMLRSKQGNENSYNASDEVNRIDWEKLVPGSSEQDMTLYYADLIRLRRECGFITRDEVTCDILQGNAIGITWTGDSGIEAYGVLNPKAGSFTCILPEGSFTYLRGGEGTVSGAVTVKGPGWILLKKD